MADINRVELCGLLGTDVELRTLPSGQELAVFSVATEARFFDKTKGADLSRFQWHHCFTCQPRLVRVLKERGRRGVRTIVVGQLEYRQWRKDGEEIDRTEPEIMIGHNGSVRFIDQDSLLPDGIAAEKD